MTSTIAASAAENLISRVEGLKPLIEAHADASESKGSLTEEVIDAYHRSGLYHVWVPKSLGGYEFGPVTGCRAIEIISHSDSSSGWVALIHMAMTAFTGAYVRDDGAAAELYSADRVPIVSGHGTRPGVAVKHEDGYLVSGQWNFGSGIKHASLTHSLVHVEGTNQFLIVTGQIEDAKLDWDSWDMLGLRATGSIDYSMDSVYIPESLTFPSDSTSSPRGGALYCLGIIGLVSASHGAWALGTTGRMLDELKAHVKARSGRAGAQADNAAFAQELADAEGAFGAARAYFYETWTDIEATLSRENGLTVDQETRYRITLTHVTRTCMDIANWITDAAGTTAVRRNVMQRQFRDLKVGTQHMTSSPIVRQNAGRMLAGADATKRWQFTDLIDAS